MKFFSFRTCSNFN